MPKKRSAFENIMSGLNEVLEWNKGKTKMRVTMPGQEPKEMTRKEYEEEKGKNK